MDSKLYTRYVTMLLLLVYVFNQLDRRVFDILMEPIKREFSLSDGQLGFVTGPALVVLYSCLGVPVARWADRGRRIRIMVVAITLWSVIATLTAAVSEFWQLTLVRVGVGIGEAGFSAVAVSVIGDYESDENRTRALATFVLAVPIAGLISYLMGGWINEIWGWRWVFVLAGPPGILLALLMRATVRDPPRRLTSNSADAESVPLRFVLSTLWRRRSLRHLAIAQGLANIVVNVMGWSSVFFIRQHHMTTGEIGSWFAFTDGVGGIIGIWLGGVMAAHFGAKDARMKTRLMAYAGVLVAPLGLFVLWCPSKYAALFGCFLLSLPMYFYFGPTAGLVQDLVGANMRATMASVFFLIQMLAGGLFGTQLVGILSDAFTPIVGGSTLALRWSMAVGLVATLGAAAHFWWAARFVAQETTELANADRTYGANERADMSLSG